MVSKSIFSKIMFSTNTFIDSEERWENSLTTLIGSDAADLAYNKIKSSVDSILEIVSEECNMPLDKLKEVCYKFNSKFPCTIEVDSKETTITDWGNFYDLFSKEN